jgi:hypothetical protein
VVHQNNDSRRTSAFPKRVLVIALVALLAVAAGLVVWLDWNKDNDGFDKAGRYLRERTKLWRKPSR